MADLRLQDKEGFRAAARELARQERALRRERDDLLQEKGLLAQTVRQLKGVAELVPKAPKYWSNHDLSGAVRRCRWVEGGEAVHAVLLRTAVHSCCAGRDGVFSAGSVRQVRVWRVENPMLWRQYWNKATELTSRHSAHGTQCTPLAPPASEQLVDIDLPACLQKKSLDASLNEAFLWHGTHASNIDAIVQDGFDERVCSLEGMLGGGLYFAEDSCKSGQYAEKSIGSSRSHWFVLSRVLLGRPHHVDQPMPDTRRAPHSFDSVVFTPSADSPLGHHREFVVYDRFQAYPEYIVEASTA